MCAFLFAYLALLRIQALGGGEHAVRDVGAECGQEVREAALAQRKLHHVVNTVEQVARDAACTALGWA